MANQALVDMIRGFGAAETAFDAAKKDNAENPPKLQAAIAMMDACEAGDAKPDDANDLTKAYFEGKGGKMPPSLAQQSSKFKVFMKAGDKNIGRQTFTSVWTQINGMNDAKDQRRAKAGIFEKFTTIMRAAIENNGVPDYSDVRAILLPDGDQTDAQVKALQAAIEALGKAETATNNAAISEMIKTVDALKVAREKQVQYDSDNAKRETVAPLAQPGATPDVDALQREIAREEKLDAERNAAPPVPTLSDVVDHGGMFN